jgi:hypothetical protein
MFDPIRVVVCARSEVCDAPETGARDQYMPLAGAGWTSGAVFASGRGGNGMCGPRGARWAGVELFGGAGEELVAVLGLAAIADVERRFKGRGVVAVEANREADGGAEGVETGGERGFSGLGVALPLPCDEDGGFGVFELEDEDDSF